MRLILRGAPIVPTNRLADIAARQLLDNAVVGAGLVDDPRTLLPRLNVVLARLVGAAEAAAK